MRGVIKGDIQKRHRFLIFFNDGLKQKGEWGLLKAGFFNGSVDQFIKTNEENNDWSYEIRKNWH